MPSAVAQTTTFDHGIVAVDTEFVHPGFDASHLIIEGGAAAFVDTGTNDSVPFLLDALAQNDLDVGDVHYVFLTHVHLDHAGGAGQLMQQLPNAVCVVHPRGAPHMIDPSKLIAGTEAVYGVDEAAKMYGTIQPIEAGRVLAPIDNAVFDLNDRGLHVHFTEGHARHHYCLHDYGSRGVFSGDNFGISYRALDTAAGAFIFPTTTPASFDPAEAHKSVDRIMSCDPEAIYLTHFSRVTDLERLAADMHERLDAYVEITLAAKDADDVSQAIATGLFEYLHEASSLHGFDGGTERLQEIIGFDVKLNADGLAIWLKRQQQ